MRQLLVCIRRFGLEANEYAFAVKGNRAFKRNVDGNRACGC